MKLKTRVIIASALIGFVLVSGCLGGDYKDCDDDQACMENAFVLCQPAKFTTTSGFQKGTVTIDGLETKTFPGTGAIEVCVVKFSVTGEGSETCYVPSAQLTTYDIWNIPDGNCM